MQRGLEIVSNKLRVPGINHQIPELVVVVDDGVNLLATGHGRAEICDNVKRHTGIQTPKPNQPVGHNKDGIPRKNSTSGSRD